MAVLRSTGRIAQEGPPRGSGRYSDDGLLWWEDARQQWFPVAGDEAEDTLEIELEDVGNSSWLRSIRTTLTGQLGTQSYRFVGRATSRDARWPTYSVASGSFPVLPLQLPLDDLDPRNAFAEEITGRLRELEEALVERGWRPTGQGQHWWSKRFARPAVRWDAPVGGADPERRGSR